MDWMQTEVYSSKGVVLDVKGDTAIMRAAIAEPGGFFQNAFKIGGIYKMAASGDYFVGSTLLFWAAGILIGFFFDKKYGMILVIIGMLISLYQPLTSLDLVAVLWDFVPSLLLLLGIFRKHFAIIPFGIIFIILGVILMLGGVAGVTSASDSEYWIEQSVKANVEIFQPQNWESRDKLDPTGYQALKQADTEVLTIDAIGIIIVIVIISVFVRWRYFK
jgi:hypothetical protein